MTAEPHSCHTLHVGDQVTPETQDHARALAMLAWFVSRGATGAGQWPGDPDDFAKQIKAREEFDAWWAAR